MLSVVFKAFLIYFLLVFFIRITGKRQIGELQLSELVTTLLISEIASAPVTNPDVPILYGVLPGILMISLEILLSYLVTKVSFLKRLLDGSPSFLIRNGKPDQKELLRQRISLDELLSNLRQQNVGSVRNVNYAVLEQNGRLSVFPFQVETEPLFDHAVIVDGEVRDDVLRTLGYGPSWLASRLKERGLKPDEVFLYTVDDLRHEYVIKKEGTSCAAS